MDYPIILHILSFRSDNLHILVSKRICEYNNPNQDRKKLPISILFTANIFQEYSNVIFSRINKWQLCRVVARLGNINALEWTRSHGCPWDVDTCYVAALFGHMELLQWARAHDCPWDKRTCSFAARNGHLAVLQWAKAHGCPWDGRHCYQMAKSNNQAVIMEWLQEQGCPTDRNVPYP